MNFSVVVKVDKKLLTVLFPDGRDGRAFTLKVLFHILTLNVTTNCILYLCVRVNNLLTSIDIAYNLIF